GAQRPVGAGVGPEVDRLAAGGDHRVEQRGAEVAGRHEARPAGALAERTERRAHALGVAARRVEDAVDDEELVDAVRVEEGGDLGRDALRVTRAHAAPLDHRVGAEGALVVAAAPPITIGASLAARHAWTTAR